MGRKKQEPVSQEQIDKEYQERDYKEAVERLRFCTEPTRFHSVGEEVIYGGFSKSVIEEILFDGKIYKLYLESMKKKDSGYQEELAIDTRYVLWHELIRKDSVNNPKSNLATNVHLHNKFRSMNNDMSSLIRHYYFHCGIDTNPEYQRGIAWTIEDKVKLIDSIFNGVEIGKFTLLYKTIEEMKESGYDFEILDGKQRLLALVDFYTDRFRYKGLLFSELHWEDRNHFLGFPVQCMQGDKMYFTKKDIYQYFLMLNTGGVHVAPEHLEKVKELYDNA